MQDKLQEAYQTLDTWAQEEGSFADVVLSAAAYMIQDALEQTLAARYAVHPTTAQGEDLDEHGKDYDIIRKAGTKATGTVQFSGASDTSIPKATSIVCDGLVYQTDRVGLVGESIPFTASEVGAAYNKSGGSNFVLLSGIGGITELTVAADVTGGSDPEDDEAYRKRLLSRLQDPQNTGTIGWYEALAESVPGVGKATCIPIWNGPGTVKVTCIDTSGLPLGSDVLQQITDLIDEQEYIGPQVTVEAAAQLDIIVSAKITGGYDESDLKERLQAYLSEAALPKDGETSVVSFAKIGYLILETEGVTDYADLKVNGGFASIAVSAGQAPVLTLEVVA